MSTHKGAKEKRLKRANALSGQAARPKNARLRQLSRKAATKAKSKRVGAAASPARFKAASAGGIAALNSRRAIGVGEVIGGALRRRFTGPGDSTNSVVDNGGGLVLTDVPLRLIFWGREWGHNPPVPHADVIADVEKILAGPYLDAARQYGITNAYVDSIVTRIAMIRQIHSTIRMRVILWPGSSMMERFQSLTTTTELPCMSCFCRSRLGYPGHNKSYSFLLIWVDCIAFQAMSTMTLQ